VPEGRSATVTGDVETYHENGEWTTKIEGTKQASSTHATTKDATQKGRERAIERGVEHVIRNVDGTIGERNTYPRSRDPRTIPG
jgi:hypothetical protein